MNFLILQDYRHLIRGEVLTIVQGDENTRIDAESAAESEIKSYLRVRYDVDLLFPKHEVWTNAKAYVENDLIVLQADDYVSANTYVSNDLIAFESNVYRATGAVAVGETPTTDPGLWSLAGIENGFYTALAAYAGAGTLPSVSTSWVVGDNRDALIKRYMIDITLYELHARINPRNIPEHRVVKRNDAISWLKMVADPRKNIDAGFTVKTFEDQSGNDLTWGSSPKRNHGQDTY